MAEDLQRYAVKYIRDRAKAKYDKGTECRICGSTENLDFHHFHSLAYLWNKWVKEHDIEINDVEDIKLHRETFIEAHQTELYDQATTLCHTHHLRLHSVYGKTPQPHTVGKQARWIEKKRVKNGLLD